MISVYAAVGSFNGSSVTMGSPFLVQQGGANNHHLSFDSVPYRWCDYSATMVDPTDDNFFWTIQEIPAARATICRTEHANKRVTHRSRPEAR